MGGVGCSDDEGSVGVSSRHDEFPLREEYVYLYQGDEFPLSTSSNYLTLKFHDHWSPSQIEVFLVKLGFDVERRPQMHSYGLYIIRTADAFAAARRLSAHRNWIAAVGPVFEGTCNGKVTFTVPGNQIIVRGEVAHDDVASWLAEADARIVAHREDDPTHYVYEIPWGDPGHLFDLALKLARHPAIQYAHPNFQFEVCF